MLAPPDVSVSGCGNCLLLHINTSSNWRLRKTTAFYRELIVVVRRSRDGAQVRPMASAVTFDTGSRNAESGLVEAKPAVQVSIEGQETWCRCFCLMLTMTRMLTMTQMYLFMR